MVAYIVAMGAIVVVSYIGMGKERRAQFWKKGL